MAEPLNVFALTPEQFEDTDTCNTAVQIVSRMLYVALERVPKYRWASSVGGFDQLFDFVPEAFLDMLTVLLLRDLRECVHENDPGYDFETDLKLCEVLDRVRVALDGEVYESPFPDLRREILHHFTTQYVWDEASTTRNGVVIETDLDEDVMLDALAEYLWSTRSCLLEGEGTLR